MDRHSSYRGGAAPGVILNLADKSAGVPYDTALREHVGTKLLYSLFEKR